MRQVLHLALNTLGCCLWLYGMDPLIFLIGVISPANICNNHRNKKKKLKNLKKISACLYKTLMKRVKLNTHTVLAHGQSKQAGKRAKKKRRREIFFLTLPFQPFYLLEV